MAKSLKMSMQPRSQENQGVRVDQGYLDEYLTPFVERMQEFFHLLGVVRQVIS